MTRGRLRALLVLVGAALLLTACGSQSVSHEEYGTSLRRATTELGDLAGDLDTATSATTTQERVERLRAVQLALRDTGNALDDLAAPDDLEAAHEELVAGVRDMADAIDDLVEAEQLAVVNPARAKELLRTFANDDALPRVQAAAARITKAGVDAGF